ncbi:hypothetical protein NEHOM01_1863 [Nematocida homosporus]|uniref:uncharacterized protein n=1 Tax=Nematocida homosporus TaxID=1912981 RepID=UPI00222089A2|nr:uncharacterized protein NEHOM01_1863 [Nematocida homosporus]KAI5187011.1 hypothetical protein NEHOM01_1863 [Nematocida homosporus]
MIHSALFEIHSCQKQGASIREILGRVTSLYRYSLLEVTNARLCIRHLLQDRSMLAEDTVELFRVCCILSRKYWRDTAEKNLVQAEPCQLLRLNDLERRILLVLNYAIGMPATAIQQEIAMELNLDRVYQRAIAGHKKQGR